MSFTVAATNPRPDQDFRYEREALDGIGARILAVHASNEATYREALADADAVIPGPRVRVTANVIGGLRRCKVIANQGIGVDSVDVDAATRARIPVTNVPDLFVDEVADQAFMLLLAATRKLVFCHQLATTDRWTDAWPGLGHVPRLRGSTLGLIAFGNIARAVALRGQAFGMQVLAFDPFVSAEEMARHGVESRSLDDLLRESDLISAHAPLTQATYHLLGDAQFALMRRNAVFVNTGRGRVVDESALIRALQSGHLGAAGLDVLEHEPPDPANPLLSLPNVVITPHMASYSNEANVARRRRVGEDIAAVLQGQRPAHVVNPAVFERA